MNRFLRQQKSLIIIGASGVGKGTIIKQLKTRHQQLFQLTLSFTTRKMRPKQIDGLDYYFVTPEQFQLKLPQMLQHKHVHKNWYGTSKSHLNHLLSQNKIPILDIDIEGMLQIKPKIQCEVLCIMPASWTLLKQRLQGRKTEDPAVVEARMKQNMEQVQKMEKLKGTSGLYFVTNYEYQLTTFGVEKWLFSKFQKFRHRDLGGRTLGDTVGNTVGMCQRLVEF